MPRSTSSPRIIPSTSCLSSSNSVFGLTLQSDDRVLDSNSNRLIDELFSNVERLLKGDLGDAESSAKPVSPLALSIDRTVQLPSHHSSRSAADLCKVATASDRSSALCASDSSLSSSSCETGYQNAGRPAYLAASCALSSGAARNNTKPVPPIQPVLNSLYPSTPDLDYASAKAEMKPSLLFLTIGAVGAVIASVLGLWTASVAFDRTLPPDQKAVATLSAPSDADFLAYQENALETIEASRRTGAQTVAGLPVPASVKPPASVPTVNPVVTSRLPKLPTVAAEASNVVERALVPTYQNGQSQHSPAVSSIPTRTTAALPPIALASASNTQRRPAVPISEPTATVTLPPNMPATGTSSIPILPASGDFLSAPGVDIAVGSTVGSTAALTDVTPTSELMLVGILSLGDRSAALFNIDGSSQRVYVGDPIGLSNWILASADGEDVMIRRNDEVRSVYIGQRF